MKEPLKLQASAGSADFANPPVQAGSAAARLGLGRFLLLLAAMALASVALMIALPHDKFLRYQTLNDHVSPTAYWVYQRIHNDPTPIDVAFIGTSRTGMSVHTKRLEEDLAGLGIKAKAANLRIVQNGINMQYVIAKELLEHRPVKLMVVEMIEWEDRKPHPNFIYLADRVDVLDAPALINLDFFSDIARLPGRQMDLFLETELRQHGLGHPDFIPPPYEGPNLDRGEFITSLDGIRHSRDVVHTEAEMRALRRQQDAAITPSVLPAAFDDLEYRLPRYYMNRILDLAQAHGTKVKFLYVPRFGGPAEPPPYARYASRAGLINPWPRLQDYHDWFDATHVNWNGSRKLTDFLAESLAASNDLR